MYSYIRKVVKVMSTLKKAYITITSNNKIDSLDLYAKVKRYGMNVLDLETRIFVYGKIDVREPIIEYVLKICYDYGTCRVDLDDAPTPSK